jgi:septum formation protein
VVVPEVAELREGDPESAVLENARRKARDGLERAGGVGAAERGLLVIGCDTEVVIDGVVLGKPADMAGARARLERLSGRTHEVLSGLVLVRAEPGETPRERAGVVRSAVTFRDLDRATIELYLRSGEWRDRAGAYAVQGLGSILVARVEGDVSNVIGLPVSLLAELAPELLVPEGQPPPEHGGKHSTLGLG